MINSFILFRWFIAAQCIRRNILIRIEFISCAINIESKYITRPNMFSDHSFLVKSYICRCNDEIVVNLTRPLKSGSIFWVDFMQKSTHNRRERPVCGHRGRSRGPFYYRITTFGKGPWDARDPHKTTFMALKHVIRLSIWQRQKETPGVEKAPGVSSPQRKESGRSGRDDGELRFGYDPAIHARRLRVYHRPRRLRMASRISIFFAARRFEPLNSMG